MCNIANFSLQISIQLFFLHLSIFLLLLFSYCVIILLMDAAINRSLLILMKSSSPFVNASVQSLVCANFLYLLLDIYGLPMSSLECKALCIVILSFASFV